MTAKENQPMSDGGPVIVKTRSHNQLAVRLIAEIERTFGKRLLLRNLLETSTVGHLAVHPGSGIHEDTSLLAAIQPDGSKPPLFCATWGSLVQEV
jgi:hypothetical protein